MGRSASVPPTIELEGIRLRPLRPDDAPALLDYLSDPIVTERTSFPVVSMALVERMISRASDRWAAGEPSRWAVALQASDQLVGTCGFNDGSPVHGWAEIAFDLAPSQWGTGRMHQAARAALSWGFGEGGLRRVQAFVRVDNARSERLLQRLGFLREGCLRSYRVCRGEPKDFYLYALLRSEHPGFT